MASKERRESIKGWREVARRKSASTLRHVGQRRASEILTPCILSAASSDLSEACEVLCDNLPINVRTNLLSEVLQGHTTSNDPHMSVRYVLFSLLSNVTRIHIKCEESEKREDEIEPVGVEEMSEMIKEIERMGDFNLEYLNLEDISLPTGLLSLVLRHSPRLHTLCISGDLCSEVLSYLMSNPITSLHTLTLHTTSYGVTDDDVVSALVTPNADLSIMGQVLCNSGSLEDFGPVRMHNLKYLSVVTPAASIGGALILIHCLKKLVYFHYTWICPVAESLLLLKQVSHSSTTPSFSLQHLDLSVPSKETLTYILELCPNLRQLEIESVDPDLDSLHMLANLSHLSTLHLSMVPEEVVLSALETIGNQLSDLKLEFEACTFHPMTTTTLAKIQTTCSNLRKFELRHVNIDVDSQAQSESSRTSEPPAFQELESLILNGSVALPSVISSLLNQNTSLKSLVLDVNQNALTDDVIVTLLRKNDMLNLSSVFLGAGCISTFTFFCLLSLPSLSNLSLDLKRFPFISEPTFKKLQQDLEDGNYQCVLENVEREE